MSLRIVDTEARLERALTLFQASFAAWSGGRDDAWVALGANGESWNGASFSDRDECYCFIEQSPQAAAIGVAMTGDDASLLRTEINLASPAGDRRMSAVAIDGEDRVFLLLSREALVLEGVREPLGRLGGLPGLHGASVGGREYVLLGPFLDREGPEALQALAALTPSFELRLERRARLVTQPAPVLFRPAPTVARRRRLAGRVAADAARRIVNLGWKAQGADGGLTARRGHETLTLQVRADGDRRTLQEAVGALALADPGPKLLFLPSPREGDALPSALKEHLELLGLEVLTFDFRGEELTYRVVTCPEEGVFDPRAVFS